MTRRAQVALAFGATAAVLPVALAAAATSSLPVTVTPKAGGTHARFVVSFRAPASTGGFPRTRRYEVSTSTRSPGSNSRCVSSASKLVFSATAGQRVQVSLTPGASRSWCVGSYRGEVSETLAPGCPPRELCPQYVAVLAIGSFSFRVT